MKIQHPFTRRLMWHPSFLFLLLPFYIYRNVTEGVGIGRTGALVTLSLWFVLALIDLFTGHRLLDWIYTRD